MCNFINIAFNLQDHFTDVILNQEYLCLPADEVKNLLSSDMLNVPSEEEAFQSLMLWVNYDLPKRKKDLPSLLETIKLPLLSPQVMKIRLIHMLHLYFTLQI